MFWLLCLCFFTGNMNLVLLLTGLLLGNSTTRVEFEANQEIAQENPEEVAFRKQWEEYKIEFSKTYSTIAEERRRMDIFMENSKFIDEHNHEYVKGHHLYELGHNQFSDLTHEEYLDQYTTYPGSEEEHTKPTTKYHNHEFVGENSGRVDEFISLPPEGVDIAATIDWRAHGAVTPVKNEGKCSASWAFSATGALESQLFHAHHHLESLSEQNLVDCTAKYGNKGCKNGTASNAYRYIAQNRGIDNNVTYPWTSKKSWFCHYKKLPYNPTIRGIAHIQSGNDTALQFALATGGPVAVAIDARSNKFRFYKRGIFYEPRCSTHALTRELLVVGYGRSFWILKNSWGTGWGAHGYIYLTKNGRNPCGIATRALYPIV